MLSFLTLVSDENWASMTQAEIPGPFLLKERVNFVQSFG